MKYLFEADALIEFCYTYFVDIDENPLLEHILVWYDKDSLRKCLLDFLRDNDYLETYYESDIYKNYIKEV